MSKTMIKMKTISILSPLGEFNARPIKLAKRINSLKGKTIGLLDANKPYGDIVMNIIKSHLEEHGVQTFVSEVKPIVTRKAPNEMIERLSKTDSVVISFGDCGSCSTTMAMDQVSIEKMNVPTVAVVTNYFSSHYARIAESMGIPDLPVIIVEHPIGDGATKEMAEEKANKIVDSIVEALTLSPNKVKEKYSVHKYMTMKGEL